MINLLNGQVPLIAIQMSALKVEDFISLVFTTVLEAQPVESDYEDEGAQEVVDREYWENRGSKETVSMTDELFEMIKEWNDKLDLKFNKGYIGIAEDGQPSNFVIFRPKKEWLRLEPRLARSDELETELEEKGLDLMSYHAGSKRYRIRLSKGDVGKHEAFLRDLLREAYEASV